MKFKDVLYTVDSKFLDIMLCSLYSLLENGNLGKVRLHVVCDKFEQRDYDKLYFFTQKYPDVVLNLYPLEDFGINIPNWRGTQIANAKMFYPRIVKEVVKSDSLLYLDADTMVVSDLSEIGSFGSGIMAAAMDSCTNTYRKKFNLDRYYNTGVLYIDLNKWINADIEEKMRYFIKHNDQDLLYPDQDILNNILKDDISKLPIRYNINAYPFFFGERTLKLFYNPLYRDVTYEEVKEASLNPIILHSCGLYSIKPWDKNIVNPFNKEFKDIIQKINPNFKFETLSGFRKLMAYNPILLRQLLLIKTYLPENLEQKTRKFAIK